MSFTSCTRAISLEGSQKGAASFDGADACQVLTVEAVAVQKYLCLHILDQPQPVQYVRHRVVTWNLEQLAVTVLAWFWESPTPSDRLRKSARIHCCTFRQLPAALLVCRIAQLGPLLLCWSSFLLQGKAYIVLYRHIEMFVAGSRIDCCQP